MDSSCKLASIYAISFIINLYNTFNWRPNICCDRIKFSVPVSVLDTMGIGVYSILTELRSDTPLPFNQLF